jgi:hypothetical protein
MGPAIGHCIKRGVMLTGGRGPNKIKPSKIKCQGISLDESERVPGLRIDVYAGHIQTCTMQTHCRASSAGEKINCSEQFSSPYAFVSSLPSTSVWAYMSAPHLRFYPAVSSNLADLELDPRSFSCCQPLVSQTLAVNCGDERIQPIQGMTGHVFSL